MMDRKCKVNARNVAEEENSCFPHFNCALQVFEQKRKIKFNVRVIKRARGYHQMSDNWTIYWTEMSAKTLYLRESAELKRQSPDRRRACLC